MKLSGDEVKKVAKLANLPISEEEEKVYAEQLSKVLDYIEKLKEVNTENVEPTYNTTGLNLVFREDTPKSSLTQDQALENAPNTRDGFFVTKGVFEEE